MKSKGKTFHGDQWVTFEVEVHAEGDIIHRVNGEEVRVTPGTTVAAAISMGGHRAFRTSVKGEARGPLCGMGICFECRATIDGSMHQRSCQTVCRPGMEITTDGP